MMIEQKNQLAKLALFHSSRTTLEQRIVRFNEIVRQEVLYAHTMGISQTDIANALGVSKQRIWQIVQEHKKKIGEES
jgi:plasmid maintenance system antidote protein VapI